MLQVSGGLTVLVAIGTGISQVLADRARRKPPPLEPPRSAADPPRSTLGERLFTIAFLAAAILLILALAHYIAWELRLF